VTPASPGSSDAEDSELEVNPLSCEECDSQAASNVGLKIHKSKKHEDIPQLDGESECERDTDEWWVKQNNYSLKIFQMYIDVLKDIEKSSLSEEEKNEEREKSPMAEKLHLATISSGSLLGAKLNCIYCG
jgi:hypothetical protein